MEDKKLSSSNHDLQDHIEAQHERIPRWKQVHHTWWFWIFLVFMMVGILYYIMSVNFAFAPPLQIEQKPGNSSTR